jgi:phytoene dehydrogenase-like protein
VALLAGCGGGRYDREPAQAMRLSSGPISKACMSSDRKARNSALCGCIQTVANQDLSGRDQRLAVSFYRDPHRAQEVRQSDRPGDESFWLRYKTYAERSEQLCRGY